VSWAGAEHLPAANLAPERVCDHTQIRDQGPVSIGDQRRTRSISRPCRGTSTRLVLTKPINLLGSKGVISVLLSEYALEIAPRPTAFQAYDEGSIPFTRSNFRAAPRLARLLQPE
jgi:hypothetical protein